MCPAAVLWCSGSHIYGVSEGQWGLLPGSARRLCRRVNGQTCHRPDTLEPQEGPGELAGPGHLPEPATTRPGWGNSTRCTLPSSASAWPESRWNQPCFLVSFLLFFHFILKEKVFELFLRSSALFFSQSLLNSPLLFLQTSKEDRRNFSELVGHFCLTFPPSSARRLHF